MPVIRGHLDVLSDPLVLWFTNVALFSIMSWLTPLLQDKGLSLEAASAMLTIMSVVQMIGNMAVPLLMEKWPSRMARLLVLSFVGVIDLCYCGSHRVFTYGWLYY